MEVKAPKAFGALQDLAEGVARNSSRQRLGVRQPCAAFAVFVPRTVPFIGFMLLSGVGCDIRYEIVGPERDLIFGIWSFSGA
jgi:hypothetical protein